MNTRNANNKSVGGKRTPQALLQIYKDLRAFTYVKPLRNARGKLLAPCQCTQWSLAPYVLDLASCGLIDRWRVYAAACCEINR